MTWAVLAGPVIGLVSAGYIRLIGWVSYHRATGTTALFAPVLAFGILGVIGIWYPQLFGNGLDMARDAFLGISSAGLLLTLFALLIQQAPRRRPRRCQPGRAAGQPRLPPPPHRPLGHPQLSSSLRSGHPLPEPLHGLQPDLLPAPAALGS